MKIIKKSKYLNLSSFAETYFVGHPSFIIHAHSDGYGFRESFIEIENSGNVWPWGCYRHKIAQIDGRTIYLKDNKYFSDIELFILAYEKKHNGKDCVELRMTEDKWMP